MDKLRGDSEEMGDHQGVLIDSQEVEDLSAVVGECDKRFGDFGTSYGSTYGRWVERQVRSEMLKINRMQFSSFTTTVLINLKGAVEEPESMGEAAVEIRNALRENAAARKAKTEVKSRVLAVKEKAVELEAMPKLKSRTDKERS